MLAFEIKNEIFGSQKMIYRWQQKFRCHILQEVVDDKKDSAIYVEAACSNVRCVADWIKQIFKDLPLPRVALKYLSLFVEHSLQQKSVVSHWLIPLACIQTDPPENKPTRFHSATKKSPSFRYSARLSSGYLRQSVSFHLRSDSEVQAYIWVS